MINIKSLIFVFILTLIASITLNAAEKTPPKKSVQDAERRFGKSAVNRFEQMFQSGEFDFTPQGKKDVTVLHYAAYMDDLDRVKLLIEKGADVNMGRVKLLDYKGGDFMDTPLIIAAENNNLEMVKILVENGASSLINAQDVFSNTALLAAMSNGNMEMFQYLIKKGAGISFDNSTLYAAAQGGNIEIFKWLLKEGIDINATREKCTCLHYAAQGGHLELVKWLVEKGLDVNAVGEYERTCLHYAALSGNLEMIKWFIEKGLDINAKDFDESSVLQYAVEGGNVETVQWLIEQGLDINAPLSVDRIPLLFFEKNGLNINEDYNLIFYAALNGNLKLIQWLVQQGEDAIKNNAVLRAAIYSDNIELVRWLIDQGADVKSDKSLLSFATERGNLEMTQYLVTQGVDVRKSKDALHFAAQRGNIELIQWLIAHGADVNGRDSMGHTVMMAAVYSKDIDVVRYFLEQEGIDINASVYDRRYHSPLEEAIIIGDFKMVKFLVEHGANVNPQEGFSLVPYWYEASQHGADPKIVKYLKERDNTLIIWSGVLSLLVIAIASYFIYRNLRSKKLVETES